MFCLSIVSLPVHKSVHGDEIGDSSGDDGRGGFRSQENSHSSFCNCLESVDVVEIGGYRSQIRHYTSHNTGCPGICWFYLFMAMIEVDIGLRPANLLPITTMDNTGPTQGYLTMLFIGVCDDILFRTVIKAVSYIHIKIILVILI